MRIIHLCFLLTVVLYLWVPSMLAHGQASEAPVVFVAVFGLLAVTSAGASLFFQARLVRLAAEQLQRDPNDKGATARWRAGVILSFVFGETVILCGLILRILGVPWSIAGIFYAVGGLLLIWFTPKLELLPE